MIFKMDRRKINSFLVAVYISETIVCGIIDSIIHIPKISVILMILLLSTNLVVNDRTKIGRMKKGLTIFLLLEVILVLSGMLNGFRFVESYGLYLIVFGFTAMVLSFNDIDLKMVISDSIVIYVIYNILYFLIIRKRFLMSESYYSQSMGIAYAESVSVYISLLTITYNREFKLKKRMKLLTVLNSLVALFIILVDCRSRGPIGAIIIAGIMFVLSRARRNTKFFYVMLFVALGITFAYNFRNIIIFVDNILKNNGINIGAINKFAFLYNSGIGVGNGREFYYEKAVWAIKTSPLIGHGVGYFEALVNGEYVHNIFLDLFVDFGIIGFIIGAYFIFYKPFVYIFSSLDKKLTGYILFLFCTGELMLNFSSSFWLSPPFWYMFFFFIQDERKVSFGIKSKKKSAFWLNKDTI